MRASVSSGLVAAVDNSTMIGPGFLGFLVMFALALATVLLIRSMTHHLRKVRYGPDPGRRGDAPISVDDGDAGVSGGGSDGGGGDGGGD